MVTPERGGGVNTCISPLERQTTAGNYGAGGERSSTPLVNNLKAPYCVPSNKNVKSILKCNHRMWFIHRFFIMCGLALMIHIP